MPTWNTSAEREIMEKIVASYQGINDMAPEEKVPAVRLLLVDVRHFCDAHGLDFAAIDKEAYDYYVNEKRTGDYRER